CLLFAARRPPSGSSGPPVEVVGAVLGQPDRAAALAAARDAVSTALAGYVTVDLRGLTPPLSGELTSRWGDSATIRPALAARSGVLTVRTGTALALRTVSEDVHAPVPAGHEVAHVEATFGSTLGRW